jgi:dTDP-4-dehydrorhamnose reductase
MGGGALPVAWVTGAAGLIGNYLCQLARELAPGWRVRGLTRAELDLADFAAVERAWRADRPQLVIHCAAMSRSPDCQADPGRARLVNVDVTRALADLASDARMVFFSTDLVFDGRQGGYDEDAAPNPLSVYAETKVAAEQAVRAHPRHLVVRTSLNGGTSPTGNRSFNEEMRRAWRAGRVLRLFVDEFRSPIHASVTARAVWELALRDVAGICHVAGTQRLSRYEIGGLVAARCPELRPRLEAGSLAEYDGAPRPPDTSLACAKAQSLLSFRLPGLGDWLAANPAGPL